MSEWELAAGVLEEAAELIRDPAAWCKGSMALDAQGEFVSTNSPTGCRRCAMGAMMAVLYRRELWREGTVWELVLGAVPRVVLVNDTEGHASVLKYLKEGARKLREKGIARHRRIVRWVGPKRSPTPPCGQPSPLSCGFQ